MTPIVIAHHLVWTAYGWWMPNDPRGSMSQAIRNDVVEDLGELHYGRKKVQPASGDIRTFYQAAAARLKHDLMQFDREDAAAIAQAFAEVISQRKYTCYACAVMPDHVHLLIRKHRDKAEQMIEYFQDTSRLRLRAAQRRNQHHPVWGGPGWKVFLHHPDDVRRTINYIDLNPTKANLPKQAWEFVKPYDGWPLHPGHSPNSPYAKRLRAVGRY